MKDKIIEILIDKIQCRGYTAIEGIPQSAIEIESLIKEKYVEWEFVKWAIIDQEIFFGELSETIILNDNPEKFYTLNEVYQYWLGNIKDK